VMPVATALFADRLGAGQNARFFEGTME
jgi:hypothetical protein